MDALARQRRGRQGSRAGVPRKQIADPEAGERLPAAIAEHGALVGERDTSFPQQDP